MEACSFREIEHDYDELVARSAPILGADPVCSTSRWVVPAAAAFARNGTPRVFRGDAGFVALLEHQNPNGPVLTAFESVWGFATPIIGPDPAALVDEIMNDLVGRLDYYALAVAGVDPDSALFEELQRFGPVGYSPTADRCVADLDAGFDSWLAARSPRFRRSLRAASNRGRAAGIRLEALRPNGPNEATEVMQRVLAIERTSWKTGASSGLIDTDLGLFTQSMSQRFAQTGDLRVLVASLDGRDIGYVLGGVVGDRYRGFQHSFDRAYSHLSIGKLLQYHQIEHAATEGITRYDLGMYMDYKQSYADRIESTATMIFAGS